MSKTMNFIEEDFKQKLRNKKGLKQTSIDKCDAMLDFCPIVSRAGTNINAAEERINSSQVSKPIILVVLHHSLDGEKVIPDSNLTVKSKQIFAVDFLFNEDDGLLRCQRNDEAFEKMARHLKLNNLTSFAYYKDLSRQYPFLGHDAANRDLERIPLIHTEDSQCNKCLKYWLYWVPITIVVFVVLVLVLVLVLLKVFKKI